MSSNAANSYQSVWAGKLDQREVRRLETQGDLYHRVAAWTLDTLRIGPGDRVLEVGCGTGILLEEVAHRVGPTGRVVGIDLAPQFVEQARARVAQLPWVTVVEGDARTFDDGTRFDVVHCRLVTMHQPDPQAFLAHLRDLAVPGGRIGDQELDISPEPGECYPPFQPYRDFPPMFAQLTHAIGMDATAGRKLRHWFTQLGLEEIETEGYRPALAMTDPRVATVMLQPATMMRSVADKRDGVDSVAFVETIEALERAHHDPAFSGHTLFIGAMLAAVGTVPAR